MSDAKPEISSDKLNTLAQLIKTWGQEAGFAQVGISDIELAEHKAHLERWLNHHYHGQMQYMAEHKALRQHPENLQSGALRSISFRMEYRHFEQDLESYLKQKDKAYISRYALGRDYHKLIRKRLSQLAKRIEEFSELNLNQRAFVDSAPVLERALAEKSGLGWIGKNTMLINPKAGSWFFLGEILTDLALPVDPIEPSFHCGSCSACLEACPTDAFVGEKQLDARKCISYLTIELKEAIPTEFRRAMGNRVFGCDDCQIVCPWNKFSPESSVSDFKPRHQLDQQDLIDLFNWNEETFLKRTEGSPIRRIGYERWLRNLSVGLGNSHNIQALDALKTRRRDASLSPMLVEHFDWAINEIESKL